MPIQRNFTFDFRGREVCDLICSADKAGGGASYSQARTILAMRAAAGYDDAGVPARGLPGSARDLKLCAYGTRIVSLLSPQRRPINNYPIEDFGVVEVHFIIEAMLTIKHGIDPALSGRIIDVFQRTALDMADVDRAETDMIRAGANIDDYWVDLSATLSRKPFVIARNNVDQFIAVMGAARDEYGKRAYIVEEQPGLTICCSSNVPPLPSGNTIEIPKGGDPETALANREAQLDPHCQDIVTTDYVIGTAFLLYEQMWRWDTVPVVVCGQVIGYMDLPSVFQRQRPAVLHGLVVSLPDAKRYYVKAFTDCLVTAAVTTTVLAIVTGYWALPAAAATFKAALTKCIETKIADSIPCIIPDLVLVLEHRDWAPL